MKITKNKPPISLKKAPKKTGVYFFLSKKNKTLYVGKAIDIRSRLRSHFADTGGFNPVKTKLLKETGDIRWELCNSEPEALIREAELIKKLKPRFNVLLRDDKNYFFVGITKEPFPKVFLTHQPGKLPVTNDTKHKQFASYKLNAKSYKLKFIGPFTDGNSLKRVLRYLRNIIPYCVCRAPHSRECLSGTMGKCFGVCCLQKQVTDLRFKLTEQRQLKKRYRKNINMLEKVLRGERQQLLGVLNRDMRLAAKVHLFEDAALLRDRIRALESVFSHAPAVEANHSRLTEDRPLALQQLQKLLGLARTPLRLEMFDMSNFHGTSAVGSMVVFTGGIPDKDQYRRFRIKTVQGIDDIAMMQEVILRRLKHAPEVLQKGNLKMSRRFTNLNLLKSGSRTATSGENDIVKLKHDQCKDLSAISYKLKADHWPLPDILCVDGGKGQIGAALDALRNGQYPISNVQLIPILGLAKGKDELHVADYDPISYELKAIRSYPRTRLPRPLRNLLTHLQDEAHRFAITYHRTLRKYS